LPHAIPEQLRPLDREYVLALFAERATLLHFDTSL